MKILTVLTYYYPHWTGLTANARRIAEGLARRGHTVTVLTSQHSPDLPLEEIVGGVRVVRLPALMRVSRGMIMPSLPTALWRLMRQAEIVHAHTPMLEAPLIAGYGRLLGRPVIITHQADLLMPPGVVNAIIKWIVTGLVGLGLRWSTYITTLNSDFARHAALLQPFRDKLEAIYPPVELPPPDRQAAAAWRRELGLEGRPLIGFAGRWVKEKGFDYLLQAIPLVRQALPDAHFVYAGDAHVVYENFFAECQPYLEPVREHVTMVGLIRDPARLANFYAMCDVFCLPSRIDCFATVQVEALLSGTPVVATDIPGAREVVQVTGMGRLAPPRDPAGIAASLVEVLRDRARYLRPRAEIEGIFSVERSVAAFEQLMLRWARSE